MKNLIKKIIPSSWLNFYHFFLAGLGAFIFRFPSQKLTVIGVTGTNGKSTVVEMVSKILEEAGFKVASISSIKFKIANQEWPNTLKMTMPGRLKLQRFLRGAVNSGCQYAILEVTSEGIKQHRHRFIEFDLAVFTNLTPEHIEAHGSFEEYRKAKGELFQVLKKGRKKNKKISVINLDDPNAKYFLKFEADDKIGYGINFKPDILNLKDFKIIKAKNYKFSESGLKFFVNSIEFDIPLIGKFNIYNALAAISVGISQGINLEIIKKALGKIRKIPGRMEKVITEPFAVFVDYAHTPDALQKAYETIWDSYLKAQNSKLICILGACGGGRDKWKRPKLGEIAAKYCHRIILTNEDPYDEDPQEIISQIKTGIDSSKKSCFLEINEILDRRAAIKTALNLAQSGDVIIITGKGCEPWMCLARGKKIPWDDREIVREELKNSYLKN